jgi:hypothetical protein
MPITNPNIWSFSLFSRNREEFLKLKVIGLLPYIMWSSSE